MYLVAYQQFQNFSFVTYRSDRPSLFPSYLKLVLLPYVKPGSCLFPVFFALDHLLIIHEQSQTSTAPSCLDISGKVLSTLITTQQVGYSTRRDLPQKLTSLRYSWRKFSRANILVLCTTSVRPMSQYIGTLCSKC